jgi:histidyl-tRNA synthetase
MASLQALRGTTDLLPDDVARWSKIEHTAKHLARVYGYRELRTPVIEEAALFLRSVGETTDIVQKEMFHFKDRGEHDIVLRPEGTAAVVRAYLQGGLHKSEGFAKLFYMGPMFRAERPQAGRFRQFHQYGAEAIGSLSPWADVEVIALCVQILRAAGVGDMAVWLSSMGSRDDQSRSAEALRARLSPHAASLCKECQSRLERNVFRVLDCKNPACRDIAWKGQSSPFLLSDASQARFDTVRRGLREAGIAFDDTKTFARGLDYYTHTVFEVRAAGLGAQDAVAAGGRYDHLVEELGGPPLGAVGFAAGIERVLMAAAHGASAPAAPARRGVYVALAKPALPADAFRLVQRLRERNVPAQMDLDGRSLKAQFREADRAGARFVAVLGEAELQQGSITLKDLELGSQRALPLETCADEIAKEMRTSCH